MNWINCTISGNTITNSTRGIALYSVNELSSTYLPSTATAEGGVAASAPDTYTTPSDNQNISITDNTISCSGTDPYASYEPLAILLEGVNLTSDSAKPKQGDVVPAGNYFISGASVTGNTITAQGHGVRLVDTRNTSVSSNKITCTGKKGSSYYGIQLREGSTSVSINKNTVTNAPSNGIYLNTKSSASSITGNTVKSAGKYGICLEQSSATTISSNKISSTASNGIFVFSGSKAKTIKSNTITSSKKYGIGLDGGTVDLIQSNTITKPSNNGINVFNNSTAKKIVSNKISSGKGYGIAIYSNKSKAKLKSNKIKSCKKGSTNL